LNENSVSYANEKERSIVQVFFGKKITDFRLIIEVIDCGAPTRNDLRSKPNAWIGLKSHQGSIILGMVGDTPIAVLAGRSHYYEGLSMQEIVHPVRTLGRLGCAGMIFTNAAGGLHPDQQAGDLVLLRDHINLIPDNPLRGPNDERLGPRFPICRMRMMRRGVNWE
jgi:hypothetical protein